MSFKSGFVSIIGRPNTGKSTLLNAVLGEKISIVSDKPQTTRNTIRGVKNLKDCQIIFLDTPGIHRAKGLLNEFMLKEAMSALSNIDCIVYLVEAMRSITGDDRLIIEGLKNAKAPVILALNKIDMVKKQALLPLIAEYSRLFAFREIMPVSALKGDGIETLLESVKALLPLGPEYFPEDAATDQPVRFIAAEIIREKIFLHTHEEVPYSTAIVIEEYKEKNGLVSISAAINVERDSQKGIIIGKKGSMLKKIGTEARKDIEALVDARVYLSLFVKVSPEWTKSRTALKEFGY